MEVDTLRKNFKEQIETADKQIAELKAQLTKTEEYRTKLLGGLETLDLLEPPAEEAAPEEAPAE
jgi:hypothetical protein|tara:strand:- start:217 stop:408 length:192 start_codon:yes stop_codon:yes gene_type:complete